MGGNLSDVTLRHLRLYTTFFFFFFFGSNTSQDLDRVPMCKIWECADLKNTVEQCVMINKTEAMLITRYLYTFPLPPNDLTFYVND